MGGPYGGLDVWLRVTVEGGPLVHGEGAFYTAAGFGFYAQRRKRRRHPMLVCPLHHRPNPCPCTRSEITHVDLREPAGIGLWECADHHRIVGPPTVPGHGGQHGLCACGLPARRIGATVIPSRL